MRRKNHLVTATVVLSVVLATMLPRSVRADESSGPATASPPHDPAAASAHDPAGAKSSTYRRLLREIDAERRHEAEEERRHAQEEAADRKRIEELEKDVQAIQNGNQQLATQVSQTQQQVGSGQKAITSQFGPFGFGDNLNAFLGSHRFTLAGTVSTGFYYSHQGNTHAPALDFELYPLWQFNNWLQFYGNITLGLSTGLGGEATPFAGVANFQIFPFGQETPFELVAGIFDKPFLDWIEDQPVNFVEPFVTAPLPYGPETFVPPSSIGLQARGGMQWGQPGQDWDYTLWIDSGPTFESAPGVAVIPAPIIGEVMNPLTGINLATNGIGYGARLRFYPLPVDLNWGRLELEASSYDAKWMNGLWYESWGAGYAYRVGPFRTRGEWLQSYRTMPSLPAATAYPGCCGPDNRQGWYMKAGYFLYGIPHPYLGDWLEPRFDKLEFSVRYSGVNQRAILANDISTVPIFSFNGSPAVYSPHAREIALALDYWIGPKIVWKNEVDLELPRAGGLLYNFPGGALPSTVTGFGASTNDQAVETQLTVQF